jgi:hypothetical protein
MKNQALVLVGILFLAVHTAQAQSPVEFKYKSNPAYSVHNYKQPDKAALARKYNLDGLKTFNYVEANAANDLNQRNYKAQAASTEPRTTGAIIPTTTRKEPRNSIDSPANYKRQAR